MNYFLVEKVLRDYSKDNFKKEYSKDFLDKVYNLFFGRYITTDQRREHIGYSPKLIQPEIRFVKENEKKILDFIKKLDKEREVVSRSVKLYESGSVSFMGGKNVLRLNTTDDFFKKNKDKIVKYIDRFVPEEEKRKHNEKIFYQREETEYVFDRNGEKVPAKKLTIVGSCISQSSPKPDTIALPDFLVKEVVKEMQQGKIYSSKEFEELVESIGEHKLD